MFRLWRRFASPAEGDPQARALEALRRHDFGAAESGLTALIDAPAEVRPGRERAFLFNKRGVARIGLKRVQDARADFESALEAFAGYAPALTNLGNLLFEAGDVGAAVARYEAAIASDPDYAVAHLNLGIAYKRAGRTAEGVRAMRKAQQLEGRKAARPTRRR
jgi:tetratricopeptide (TPR) repeat protein